MAGGAPFEDAPPPNSSLQRLRTLLLQEGGLMRSLLADGPLHAGAHPEGAGEPDGRGVPDATDGSPAPPGPAQVAARGPRVGGRGADYELLIEMVYEGYLLHYHAPRVVRAPEDDLGLLAGDRLYALGLARLIELGDIEAVAELADVITLSALAHGSGRPELAAAVWMAGARAVGWGASPLHERAKALTRAGSPEALEAMRSLTVPEGP
jgi:hypothetical protein